MTVFYDWLATATAGDKFIYHSGFLADHVTPPSPAEKAEGEAALQASALGKMEIAQKRIKAANLKRPGSFEYVAWKRREVCVPLVGGERWRCRLGQIRGHWA